MHLYTKPVAVALLLGALLLGPIGSANAIDRVWNGQLSGAWQDALFVTNWFNPNNGFDNGIPDADDVAIFNQANAQRFTVGVDPGRTVQALKFAGGGFQVVGFPLTLTTGDITTSGGSNVIGSDLILSDNGIWDIGSILQVGRILGERSIAKTGAADLLIVSDGASVLNELLILNGVVDVRFGQVTANRLSGSGFLRVRDGGTFVLAGNQDSTFSGALQSGGTGTNTFVKQGSGALTLSGNNGFGGVILFDEGKIVATNDSSLGAAEVREAGGMSTLEYQSGVILGNQIDTSSIRLQVPSGSATHSGLIMGSGSVTKTGNGTLALAGANSYAGGTNISAGRLTVNTGSLPQLGAVINNAELEFDQSSLGTYAGAISGSGEVIKTGAGTLLLSGSNSYTGGTTISQDGIVANTNSLPAAGGVLIESGATLQFDQMEDAAYTGVISGGGRIFKVGDGVLTLAAGNNYTGGTSVFEGVLRVDTTSLPAAGGVLVDVGGALQFDQSSNGTYAGTISGSGRLLVTGGGTLELTANNTYTGGTTVSSGQLQVSTNGLPAAGGVEVEVNGQLQFNQSSDGAYSGVISGTGSLFKAGAGRLTLTGDNTYGAFTSIAEGTLQVAANNLPPGGLVFNFAALEFEQATTGLFSGMIAGPGGLTKTDKGQLTLTGDNFYAGGTTISGGTLIVAAPSGSATGTGPVSVKAGASFQGTGLSSGETIVESGGRFFLEGQFSVGSLTLDAGSLLEFGGLGEGLEGELTVQGSAALGGVLEVDLLSAGLIPSPSDVFSILTAGSLSGTFTNVADGDRLFIADGAGSFLVTYNSSTASVVLSDFVDLPGDYNDDGLVNAADYTVWRDSIGAAPGTLVNDLDGGTIGTAQYDTWRANFGANDASATSAIVPEPNATCLLLASVLAGSFRRRR